MADDFEIESTVNGVVQPDLAPDPEPDPAPQPDPAPEPETDPAAPPEADADASKAAKTLSAKKGSLQARIDAITREKHFSERERDDARLKADALERELQALKAPKETPKPQTYRTRPEPTEDEIGTKYETYGAYVKDLSLWIVQEQAAEQAEHTQRTEVRRRHAEYQQGFVERIAAAEQGDPDFWSKMSPAVVNLRPSGSLEPGERPTALTAIADVIFSSDLSTALMLHFSTHDRDLQRLSTLPPNMLYRELGKLEAQLTPAAVCISGPAPRPVSAAPAPIKPVGAAASAGDPLDLSDELSDEEWLSRAQKQRNRR